MTGRGGGEIAIVVADDEPAILSLLEVVLQRVAARVITVTTGEAAWEAIQRERPDVAIVDWHMVGVNGLEIARRVRGDPRLGHVRVIVITGLTNGHTECLQAGADSVLQKPFSSSALIAEVERLVGRRAA